MNNIKNNWKSFAAAKKNCVLAIIISIYAAFIITFHYHYLLSINQRPGVILNDPILNAFGPFNLSCPIFLCTYFPIIAMIFYCIPRPNHFIAGLFGYSSLLGLRMITMAITPLEPPPTMIMLVDPFLDWFLQSPGQYTITKDLFFSGHTSTVFLFAFFIDHRLLKIAFFISGTLVGILITLQHVHYSVDTITAPIFAYAIYRLTYKVYKFLNCAQKIYPKIC